MGRVVEINIAAEHGAPCEPAERIEVLPGQGVVGERHFLAEPAERRGNDITLIDLAAVETFVTETNVPLTAAETRRNVVTEGVDVNALVGKRFRIGAVECRGVELCEPCNSLQGHLGKPVLVGLLHRGGLNADVVTGGAIAVGDELVVLDLNLPVGIGVQQGGMRVLLVSALALLTAATAGAAAPHARLVARAALPGLTDAAVASDGARTWVVFRPDDSPPYAALMAQGRLVPGPRLVGIFSPNALVGATPNALWFSSRTSLLRLSPRTGRITRRLTPGRLVRWDATAIAHAQQLLWWGSTLVDPTTARLLGALPTPPLVATPALAAGSIWLGAGDAVRRYSVRTGHLQQRIRWPGRIPTAGPVAFRGRLWVAFQRPDLAASEVDVRAIDPSTGRLGATLTLPAIPGSEDAAVIMRPVDLHAAAGALWLVRPQVAKAYARLYRLDTATGAATPEVAVPYTNLTRIAWRGPELWTTDGRVVFDVRVG